MKHLFLLGFYLFLAMPLVGCAGVHTTRGDNFFPYISAQKTSIPMAYGDTGWSYPEGTKADAIIESWKRAGIMTSASRNKKTGLLDVRVGPAFYALAPMDQRGLAHAIANVYGVGKKDKGVYSLVDSLTGKTVGVYTGFGLQLY